MLSWFRPKDNIAAFWRWFQANADDIWKGVERQDHDLIITKLGDRLSKVHPTIVHEIGKPDEDTVELIISADGMKEALPAVLALTRDAPKLSGFLITAFRPRRPRQALKILDRDITGEDVRYRSEFDGEKLNLVVFIDGDFTERERSLIGFLMLDQALGEYDVMTGVGTVRFESIAPPEVRPLADLAAEFDGFRGATTH
ncbi:MAG TPA: hypothetical protein VNZ85_06245 [Caulobacter sp.]|nr:hypothetical protein [Caulobacter sp.]